MEWKVRQFVIEVINYAIIQKKEAFQAGVGGQAQKLMPGGLKLDGEKGIEQFNQRVCPDLTVGNQDDTQMVYIIEIKNLRTKQGKGIIRTAITENLKQLRNYCLKTKVMQMWGISTNFGLWVFTKYDKRAEMLEKQKNPF